MLGERRTILITGGAGFIGSHLTEQLLALGNKVIVLDNLSTGNANNINHLKESKHFKFIVDSILNESVVEEMVKSCDVVYHLAAAVGVRLIIEQPSKTIETNVSGTEIVLKMCSKYHKKIVLASTSEVYGSGISARFKENDPCIIGPPNKRRWSYAASKLIDEHLAFSYWHEKQLPVIIVRFFNTIGPRQTGRYGMVVPTFVKQAMNNDPVTVYGDGKQSRSFLSVSDAVRVLATITKNDKALGEVFNIGSEEETSIEQLAQLVIKTAKSTSSIQYIPYSEAYGEAFDDMRRRVPDISKLNKLNGFTPKVRLEDIIKTMIKFHVKNNNKLSKSL